MYIDFAKIEKSIIADNICFDYLDHEAEYSSGWNKFYIKNIEGADFKNRAEVWYNDHTKEVKFIGSIPYLMQGHNFTSARGEFIEGIDFVSGILNCNMYEGRMTGFEFGSIIEVPYSPEDFLHNHISMNKHPLTTYHKRNRITGKAYEDSMLRFKIYNAGLNIKNKLQEAIREDLSTSYGYDKAKHYMKAENHYKKPALQFQKRSISVNDLLNPCFMERCKKDLIETYQKVKKTGMINTPKDKADLTAITIPLIVLKELGLQYGFNAETLVKQKIKSFPESSLNANDKKARQKTLKTSFKKLENAEASPYDISHLLAAQRIN
jgi:hypothetical protein